MTATSPITPGVCQDTQPSSNSLLCAHYTASDPGVDGLTRHLARELAPDVRVNSVQPGTLDVELFEARYAHAPLERDRLLSHIPLARIGQPEDIADAVAFLASDSAATSRASSSWSMVAGRINSQ